MPQALDYLKRKGLQGSPLGSEQSSSAQGELQPDIIARMLDIARRARDAMDSAEDEGKGLHWDRANFDTLSAAVDKLDELPDDDQPEYVMGPAAKAAWALSKTAHPETWKAVPPKQRKIRRYSARLRWRRRRLSANVWWLGHLNGVEHPLIQMCGMRRRRFVDWRRLMSLIREQRDNMSTFLD